MRLSLGVAAALMAVGLVGVSLGVAAAALMAVGLVAASGVSFVLFALTPQAQMMPAFKRAVVATLVLKLAAARAETTSRAADRAARHGDGQRHRLHHR